MAKTNLLLSAWRFLGSFAMAVTILLFLFALTLAGTFAQVDQSLFDVQRDYFESAFVRTTGPWGIPIFLPGGNLLISLLFINLIVGGMVRLRRSWSRAGIFIIHIGIATLLLGSLVEFVASQKGHMTLEEGGSADYFTSYHEYEVAVLEPMPDGSERAHVIPGKQFVGLETGGSARFESDAWPFSLVLSGFLQNCIPDSRPGKPGGPRKLVLVSQAAEKEAEMNRAGISATIVDEHGARRKSVLWSVQRAPWVTTAGGKQWGVTLRKRRWLVPFRVELLDFERELHPGMSMAASFASDVRRYEGDTAEDVHISMNEPMRREGYTFYQSGWGPQNAGPGARLYSVFSVVRNPTDQVPAYACFIIALGLLIHFCIKLYGYIRAESRLQGATQHAAS